MLHIVIPCKGFARGKSRLAAVLSPSDREALCRDFFDRTLKLAQQVIGENGRIAVVSEDAAVRARAQAAGAMVIIDDGKGLNAALTLTNNALSAEAQLAVLPTDLPRAKAEDIEQISTGDFGMAIVPDQRGIGTNALVLSARARAEFPFSFGRDSFRRHLAVAASRHLNIRIHRNTSMGFDVDEIADFVAWSTGLH